MGKNNCSVTWHFYFYFINLKKEREQKIKKEETRWGSVAETGV